MAVGGDAPVKRNEWYRSLLRHGVIHCTRWHWILTDIVCSLSFKNSVTEIFETSCLLKIAVEYCQKTTFLIFQVTVAKKDRTKNLVSNFVRALCTESYHNRADFWPSNSYSWKWRSLRTQCRTLYWTKWQNSGKRGQAIRSSITRQKQQ